MATRIQKQYQSPDHRTRVVERIARSSGWPSAHAMRLALISRTGSLVIPDTQPEQFAELLSAFEGTPA